MTESTFAHDNPAFVLPTGTEEEAKDEAAEDGEETYSDWTVEELSTELENRGLPKSGLKAELVERLEEDDASEE